MKFLKLSLFIALTTLSSSFADSAEGTVSVDSLNSVRISNIRIEGEAAEHLYGRLELPVRDLSAGAKGKIGESIACYKDFQRKGFHCSMNLIEDTGAIDADGVSYPNPAGGGSNR
jgi:hypothetical protein